jgi:hypothetical protein
MYYIAWPILFRIYQFSICCGHVLTKYLLFIIDAVLIRATARSLDEFSCHWLFVEKPLCSRAAVGERAFGDRAD